MKNNNKRNHLKSLDNALTTFCMCDFTGFVRFTLDKGKMRNSPRFYKSDFFPQHIAQWKIIKPDLQVFHPN